MMTDWHTSANHFQVLYLTRHWIQLPYQVYSNPRRIFLYFNWRLQCNARHMLSLSDVRTAEYSNSNSPCISDNRTITRMHSVS